MTIYVGTDCQGIERVGKQWIDNGKVYIVTWKAIYEVNKDTVKPYNIKESK